MMKKRNGFAFFAALLLVAFLLSLTSCFGDGASTGSSTTAESTPPGYDIDALAARIDASRDADFAELELASIGECMEYWGFPSYFASVLERLELYYNNYYIGELPEFKTLALAFADYFVEYASEINLADKEEVTGLLADCYLAAAGDRYSYYMDAAEFSDYMSDLSGDFVGIGVRVEYHSIRRTLQITSVMKDTPAMQAGLLPGDLITAVDGALLDDVGYYTLIDMMKGEPGSEVTVTVVRNGETLSFTMARAKIVQVTAEGYMLEGEDKIGYIRISEFDDTTYTQFVSAYEALLAEGATSYIFDVRDNPGGALTAILAILDYMIVDGQPLAGYLYYDGSRETSIAEDGHSISSTMPIAVLTNANTASAGELFSSALSDYGKAGLLDVTLVGTLTYGKGTMQTLLSLPGDRAVAISAARYDPPYSPNYEGVGVTPDIPVELSEEVQNKSLYLLTREEDTQLQAAIAVVKGEHE